MGTGTVTSTDDIRILRERTGAGILSCRHALEESGGDVDYAIGILAARGFKARPGRVVAEGAVFSWVDAERQVGAIVEVNCETDFAAKSAEFQSFGAELARVAVNETCDTVEQLVALAQPTLTGLCAKLGENVVVRRVARYAVGGAA